MLRDAAQTALFEVLNRNRIPFEWNRGESYVVMKETGSKILLRAVEEFERLRGSNLAWFGIDELTYAPEAAWLRLEGRLRDPKATRLCGFGVWTPKGYDWVHRRFVAEPIAGYETVRAKPFENRFLLDKVPDYYDRLLSSYDARLFEQEVFGEYLNLTAGSVYYAFEREGNVAECAVDESKPLLWALDFNVDPMSSIIAQVDKDRLNVLDEIVLKRATTMQACLEFQTRFPSHAAGLRVYADATGARMQTTGSSDIKMLNDFFGHGEYGTANFRVPLSNPPVRDRVNVVNAKLARADGQRKLMVAPRCKELIKDLEQVIYKENSQLIDKDRDSARTHLSDALGYLVWQEFGGGTVGERGKGLLSA